MRLSSVQGLVRNKWSVTKEYWQSLLASIKHDKEKISAKSSKVGDSTGWTFLVDFKGQPHDNSLHFAMRNLDIPRKFATTRSWTFLADFQVILKTIRSTKVLSPCEIRTVNVLLSKKWFCEKQFSQWIVLQQNCYRYPVPLGWREVNSVSCGSIKRSHSTGGQGDLVMTSADEEYRTDQQVCLPPLPAGPPTNPKQRRNYYFFSSDTNPHSLKPVGSGTRLFG